MANIAASFASLIADLRDVAAQGVGSRRMVPLADDPGRSTAVPPSVNQMNLIVSSPPEQSDENLCLVLSLWVGSDGATDPQALPNFPDDEMARETDAILERLDNGIPRLRQELDTLLSRLRTPAAV
jgi:hypothetical protein